jgi:hypothetical protein
VSRPWWRGALLVALGLAALAAPFACKWPDGLEKVASSLGFASRAAAAPPVAAPLASYHLPGVTHAGLSTGLAGALGALLVFTALYGVACLLAARATRLVASDATRRHADTSS